MAAQKDIHFIPHAVHQNALIINSLQINDFAFSI